MLRDGVGMLLRVDLNADTLWLRQHLINLLKRLWLPRIRDYPLQEAFCFGHNSRGFNIPRN